MPSFVALLRQRSALAALLLTALALALCAPGCTRTAGLEAPIFPDREGPALLTALRAEFAPDRTLGYAEARDVYFEHLMDTYGQIRGVYTGYTVTLTPGADPSQDAYQKGISTEHTWPQSMGTSEEPAKSDLHHLFPVRADVNSARSNDPYAEIEDTVTQTWYCLEMERTAIPQINIGCYSEDASGRFEPREDFKGDAARALFYVFAIYRGQVSARFFEKQRETLLQWQYADPITERERSRNKFIEALQGTANPFVLDPTLARRAFGEPISEPSGRGKQRCAQR